jgi:hypothetical protein
MTTSESEMLLEVKARLLVDLCRIRYLRLLRNREHRLADPQALQRLGGLPAHRSLLRTAPAISRSLGRIDVRVR